MPVYRPCIHCDYYSYYLEYDPGDPHVNINWELEISGLAIIAIVADSYSRTENLCVVCESSTLY